MRNSAQLITNSVRRLYEAKKKRDKVNKYYDEIRKKEQVAISNYMYTNLGKNETRFEIKLCEGEEYYESPVNLSVTKIRKQKINWLPDKLKQVLDKQTYRDITEKTYTIVDMNGLIKYLKECGVNPKRFKQYIYVEEELNKDKLESLYESGVIDMKDLKDCYEIEVGEPYIKLTELRT